METVSRDDIQNLQLNILQDYLEIKMKEVYGAAWISEVIRQCENKEKTESLNKHSYKKISELKRKKGEVMITKKSFDITLLNSLLAYDFCNECSPDECETGIFKNYIRNIANDKNDLVSHISDFGDSLEIGLLVNKSLKHLKEFLLYLKNKGWDKGTGAERYFIKEYLNKVKELTNRRSKKGDITNNKYHKPLIFLAISGFAAIIVIIIFANTISGNKGEIKSDEFLSDTVSIPQTADMVSKITEGPTEKPTTEATLEEGDMLTTPITTITQQDAEVVNETTLEENIKFISSPDTIFDGNALVQIDRISKKESTITISIINYYDNYEISTFGLPTMIIEGESRAVNPFDNMIAGRVEVAPNTSTTVTYKVDRELFDKGGKIEGELFIMGPSQDRRYSLTVGL